MRAILYSALLGFALFAAPGMTFASCYVPEPMKTELLAVRLGCRSPRTFRQTR